MRHRSLHIRHQGVGVVVTALQLCLLKCLPEACSDHTAMYAMQSEIDIRASSPHLPPRRSAAKPAVHEFPLSAHHSGISAQDVNATCLQMLYVVRHCSQTFLLWLDICLARTGGSTAAGRAC